jgi:hypothetical protein
MARHPHIELFVFLKMGFGLWAKIKNGFKKAGEWLRGAGRTVYNGIKRGIHAIAPTVGTIGKVIGGTKIPFAGAIGKIGQGVEGLVGVMQKYSWE